MSERSGMQEAARLEELWRGSFGDAYLRRNAGAGADRLRFWTDLLGSELAPSERVLEVGCADGQNLRHLAALVPPSHLCGADINRRALERVSEVAPGASRCLAGADRLPFADGAFDVVIHVCLLIHQPDAAVAGVMGELVRCARRLVVSGEYHADERTPVPYHGEGEALLKRDYGRLYGEHFPDLALRTTTFADRDQGFDRVTFHVLEKR